MSLRRLPYSARKHIFAALGIDFTTEQLAFIKDDERFPVIGGGERAGKSFAGGADMVPHVVWLPQERPDRFFKADGSLVFQENLDRPRNPDFLLIGPTYAEPRIEFQYIEDWLRKLGMLAGGINKPSKPQDGPWRMVTTSGVVIQTWSMEDPTSIRALDLEGVLVCEAGKCPYSGIERLQGRVSAKRGFIIYSGCLRGDSLVQTDHGLLSLEELEGEQPFKVRNRNGDIVPVSQWHRNGCFPTKVVRMQYGLGLEGTLHHKVQVRANARAGRIWKRLDELVPGDDVFIALGSRLFGEEHLAPDDAYLAGLYLGDGSAEVGKRGGARVTITCGPDETETHEFLSSLGFVNSGGKYHWRSTKAADVIRSAGVDLGWKAGDKRIPEFIRRADYETQRHFLAGLFDADGCAHKDGRVTLTSKSRRLLEEVQQMLINIGLLGGISKKCQSGVFPQGNGGEYTGYTLSVAAGADFQERIGFRLSRKAERATAGGKRQRIKVRQEGANPTAYGDVAFATVLSVTDGECDTFDLSVPEQRSYTANGIITHNTMENSQQWYQDWMLMGQRDNHLGIKSYSIPTYTNRHEFPGGREDPEIKRLERIYPEDVFAMRVLAEPRPPRTRVITEATTQHIKKTNPPKDAEIEVWIDPGYASAYAVLWVAHWLEEKDDKAYRRFHIFNEHYEQGLTTPYIVALVKKQKHWPRVKEGVIDIAGKGHRDAGESALEIWKAQTNLNWNMRYWREDPLIERVRTSFKQGAITIDPRCKGLIAELGLGEPVFPEMHFWKYPTDRDGRVISEKPIDKWNHACKALGYGLLHHLKQVERVRKPTPVSRMQKRNIRRGPR